MQHLHILGIGGTFMSAVALLARQAGYRVSGCDAHCYPPVSDLLINQGIDWIDGYEDVDTALKADLVVVGNAIKRGMPVLEAVLDRGKPYTSGPQWLQEAILSSYQVIAVAGTHGKTTTSSMLTWILECSGMDPAFLIGGVPGQFKCNARLGKGKWFVIEADEYDTAFFDKAPKLMHYRPRIAILNNLEFDHADIYPDLAAIKKQMHYFLRTIPSNGLLIQAADDPALQEVVAQGLYSELEDFSLNHNAVWSAQLLDEAGSSFTILMHGEALAQVNWSLIGCFNVENALAACAAAYRVGVSCEAAAQALSTFAPVKRRLEVRYQDHEITLYDDFAHHPTAIAKTIMALRASKRHKRLIVILEFASYTMRTGVHAQAMAEALSGIDAVYVLEPQDFSLAESLNDWTAPYFVCKTVEDIVQRVTPKLEPCDGVLVKSNKGFQNIHERLSTALRYRFS